jgi:putative hemolysin
MNQVTTEIIIIFLLILANSIFSLSEMSIVSARKIRLQQQAQAGDKGAQTALALAQEPNRFLSTVQIGITLIGILTGVFGGATLAEQISGAMAGIAWLAPYSEALAVAVVVLAITFLSLVLGELVPKRLALNNAERLASMLAPMMSSLSRFAKPVVQLLSFSTDVVLRILRVKPSSEPSVTEQEVRQMIYEGTRTGVFEAVEQEIVERVFRLGDRKISTMMTYRTDVVWLNIEDPIEENLDKIAGSAHSRYPVRQRDMDTILGIIQVKDLYALIRSGETPDLRSLLRPALFIPESMTALEVLEKFKQQREHLAIVVDEFGGVMGLVALGDVLQAIVGDIPTVEEEAEPQIIRREDGSLLLDGMLSIDELRDILHLEKLPEEGEGVYETLGGLLMAQLGRIPSTGDRFSWGELIFEVVDMDGYRVDKVLVTSESSSTPQ